jgi:hypothetical protein
MLYIDTVCTVDVCCCWQAWVEAEALAEEAAWRELDKAEANLRLNTSATSNSTAAAATAAGGTSITGDRSSHSAAAVSVLTDSSRSQRVHSSSSSAQQQQQQQQPRSAGFSPTHSRRLSASSSCCSDRLTEDCDRGSSSWGTVCEGGGSSEAGVLSKRELHRKLLRYALYCSLFERCGSAAPSVSDEQCCYVGNSYVFANL